jgi:hypothetical protein
MNDSPSRSRKRLLETFSGIGHDQPLTGLGLLQERTNPAGPGAVASARVRTAFLAAAVALSVPASAAHAAAPSTVFQTPSGNIACAYEPKSAFGPALVRCDIRSQLHPAPTGRRCEFDWGAMEIGVTGSGRPGCISDTVAQQNAPVLAYGKTWRRGGFVCTSQADGLTCRRGAHGFFLSRASWRRW